MLISDFNIYIPAILIYNDLMNFDFSITNQPIPTAPIALRTVYIVHADLTYDVKKGGTPNRDLVALRTIGGMGNVKIDGLEEITVLPGAIIFFKHTDVQRYYCCSENWDFWWFEFASNEVLNIPMNTLLRIEPVENELNDNKACLELLRKNDAITSSLASATFSLLLYKWIVQLENSTKVIPHRDDIQKAIDYMKKNINCNISVKAMAEIAGLCERRFREVFRDITGIPPKKFIESFRVSMAEELLRNTPLSINAISEKLGYSSQFHFNNAFRKSHAISPSQYRKRCY